MANVSSSNGLEKRPKLRFPGFDEPWEICTAEELFQNVTDKNHPDETILTIVQGKGTLPREQAGRNIHYDDASLSNYKMVQKGDFIIHLRSFEGGLEMANENGIVSPAYTILRGKKPHSSRFYEAYFHTDEFVNHVLSKSVEGIRDGRQISYDAFKWLGLPYCSPSEQAKIAELFSVLTKRIEKQTVLVDSLKKYKRGLHKLVFIKNRKPSWEKSALHDIASFCGGGTPSKDVSSYWDGEIGWISSSDIQEEWIDDISVTRRITKKAIDNSATKLCPEGTIAIVSRVGVGKVAIIPESLCTSQDFTNITSITGNTHYMAYQIAFRMKLEAMKTQGTSIKGVTADTIKSMGVDIPPLEEQKKIADMLTAFDSYIKRAVYELDIFLTMKKALLQQLFI